MSQSSTGDGLYDLVGGGNITEATVRRTCQREILVSYYTMLYYADIIMLVWYQYRSTSLQFCGTP